jgi:hypothetical protein
MPEIKSQRKNSIQVFAKSGMNEAGPGYRGRPYGGVALVCKQHNILIFSELETSNDRVVAVKVSDPSGAIVQVLICVYMPFYQRGNTDQTEAFLDTIDALQALVDIYGPSTPLKIIGDLNVQLPTQLSLSPGWHKRKGFNSH